MHLCCHDFVIKTIYASYMLICKNRKREVDEQDQSDRGVKEVREESGFETANNGVHDHCKVVRSMCFSEKIVNNSHLQLG